MPHRISLMIDDENYDNLIKIQTQIIEKTQKTVSFARVANKAFKAGLKNKKELLK